MTAPRTDARLFKDDGHGLCERCGSRFGSHVVRDTPEYPTGVACCPTMTAPLTDARLAEIERLPFTHGTVQGAGPLFYAISDLLAALAQCREERERLERQVNASVPKEVYAALVLAQEDRTAALAQCREERRERRRAENETSEAYIVLRRMIPGALDTPFGPTAQQVYEQTEKALSRVLSARDAATAALAAARRLVDHLAGDYRGAGVRAFDDLDAALRALLAGEETK